MTALQYELLKCVDCGKTLGYIYVSAKLGLSGTIATRYWNLINQPALNVEKTAFCETCFQKRVDEISKGQPEPKSEKDRIMKPRAESKDRSLIR